MAIQNAAVAALGARYGGVVVLSARTGAVEADAGLGMDVVQPPGSSFKTITSAAALTAGKTTLDTQYTYARYALLDGWRLHNFHHEDCGGSLVLAFAVSCNSVFGPLAVSVGAPKLVAMADAFGFNHPASIAYPVPESVTRPPSGMTSDLDLGVAGIGQGGVLASPLQMASVAQTIGSGCTRRPPFLVLRPKAAREPSAPVRACSRHIAAEVTTMMEAVVTEGTGVVRRHPGCHRGGEDRDGRGRPAHPHRCLVHRLCARGGAEGGGGGAGRPGRGRWQPRAAPDRRATCSRRRSASNRASSPLC